MTFVAAAWVGRRLEGEFVSEGNRTWTAGMVGDIFSTVASDNAEVVPPDAHARTDGLWSTAARPAAEPDATQDASQEAQDREESAHEVLEPEIVEPEILDGEFVEEPPPPPNMGDQRHTDPPPLRDVPWAGAGPGAGGVFSAEPTEHFDDVLDADEDDFEELDPLAAPDPVVLNEPPRPATPNGEPLFSSGRGTGTPDPWSSSPPPGRPASRPSARETSQDATRDARSPFAAEGPQAPHRADRERAHVRPRTSSGGAPPGDRGAHRSPFQGRSEPGVDHRAVRPSHVGLDGSVGPDEGVPDPSGLREAVARLDPAAVQRTVVPIAVCGALLRSDERVLGVVTGQMLGRPAVIVVTGARVLVVNDRRWQPIVDEFPIDSSLVVRGRHDRNVAALSFADASRLAMVDGITQVELAIELAEHIRAVGGG